MTRAKYIETFAGYDYFRDKYGNIYTICDGKPAFCSNLKRGNLTDDKAEPSYPADDVELVYNA